MSASLRAALALMGMIPQQARPNYAPMPRSAPIGPTTDELVAESQSLMANPHTYVPNPAHATPMPNNVTPAEFNQSVSPTDALRDGAMKSLRDIFNSPRRSMPTSVSGSLGIRG